MTTPIRRVLWLALPVLVFTATACSSATSPTAQPESSQAQQRTTAMAQLGELTITGGYIPQPASPDVAAVYLTVTDAGGAADRVTRVVSDVTTEVVPMTETDRGGTGSMTALSTVVIPAHGSFHFTPGHAHLMLEHPTRTLRQGDRVRLTITFAHAGTVTVTVPVVPTTGPWHAIDERHAMTRRIETFPLTLAAAALLAACSSHSATPTVHDSLMPIAVPRQVTVTARDVRGLGAVLVDGTGHVLYMFPPDAGSRVTCAGPCAGTWPPLVLATGSRPTAGTGVNPADLSTLPDPNSGARIVTYAGYPLYRYAGDLTPGTAHGQALFVDGGPGTSSTRPATRSQPTLAPAHERTPRRQPTDAAHRRRGPGRRSWRRRTRRPRPGATCKTVQTRHRVPRRGAHDRTRCAQTSAARLPRDARPTPSR